MYIKSQNGKNICTPCIHLPCDSRVPFLDIFLRKMKNVCPQKDLYENVHNRSKWEIT